MENKHLPELKKKVKTLPQEPGVYIMLDEKSEVLYVGKAKRLKNRVSSYFVDSSSHSEKTRKLVTKIATFDVIVASSEYEAFILECSLIRRHKPQYNILLKDGGGFAYIRVDMREQYPKLSLEHAPMNDGAQWFGPYYGFYAARTLMNAVADTMKLCDCPRVFPRDIGKERPCLYYHMQRCIAPCLPTTSAEDYHDTMKAAVSILDGKFEKLASDLKQGMNEAAEALRFEKAAQLRDRLNGIMRLAAKQNVIAGRLADTDVVGISVDAKAAVVVLHYLEGALVDKHVELLDESGDAAELLDAFVTQFYANTNRALPKQILLPIDIENRENLERMFTERAGRKVEILIPQRGEKMFSIKLAEKNALEEAGRVTTRTDRGERLVKLLGSALGMEEPPRRIEAFDISNLAGTDTVASLTVHQNGQPYKQDYRRFKIKTVDGGDDYGAMREAVTRRMVRLRDGDTRFGVRPDLLLIDGGAVHAGVAEQIVREFGYDIPVYGMVKDDRHKTRALVDASGREVDIRANPQLFGFVGRIQEETHRFAIEYNRELRRKRIYGSELDKIEGVGPARKTALLKHFGSMKKIKAATKDELADVVGAATAEKVAEYFME